MEDNTDNNLAENGNEQESIEFQYSFINMPWDDRTTKSKTFVTLLLVSIFVATMALVVNNFCMHYKNFESIKNLKNAEIQCYRLRIDELAYVARFHSDTTNELLCLGAVVSPNSVLVNGVCVRSGPLRMFVGSITVPRCRKGFSVDVSESVTHPAVLSNKLILLSSFENIQKCSEPIKIGHTLDWNSKVQVIGRPYAHGRVLSRQHLHLAHIDFFKPGVRRSSTYNNYTIIVKDLTRCPVRAGDLMLQDNKLFGLAAYQRNKLAFFASLEPVKNKLKEIDTNIILENFLY